MADEARQCTGNPYKLQVILADIGRTGERIQRLMLQAAQGADS